MNDYYKNLVEVDEILNYLADEEYEKIPKDVIQFIKENKDKDYIWKYDEKKELKDQSIQRGTIAILSYINIEYLLNEEQKKILEQIHDYNQKKIDEAMKQQCDTDTLFPNNRIKKSINIEDTGDTEKAEITVYKHNFLNVLFCYLKKIFSKK